MSLKETIESDIKKAMLAKNQDDLRALRAIKSLILLAETEKGASAALSSEKEIQLLTKAAKQRKESADIFGTQGRADLQEKELHELAVIEKYLPKQLTKEEIIEKIKGVVSEIGAKGPGDMGKVMGVASKQLAGLADGKVISETVKEVLAAL
ncbi:MAG: GatB/YqeY domain-containing protein [Cytophagaceae bacterium]|jgi:hypothetical protein|nr:GatB/YqeY domain-containing protein [Cytophagaceae bacterium]